MLDVLSASPAHLFFKKQLLSLDSTPDLVMRLTPLTPVMPVLQRLKQEKQQLGVQPCGRKQQRGRTGRGQRRKERRMEGRLGKDERKKKEGKRRKVMLFICIYES